MRKYEYIIDFTGCKYVSQIHAKIKKSLDFPDYYGENGDAFWDCLSDLYLSYSEQETIVFHVIGMQFVPKDLRDELKIMTGCINDLEPYFRGSHVKLEIL